MTFFASIESQRCPGKPVCDSAEICSIAIFVNIQYLIDRKTLIAFLRCMGIYFLTKRGPKISWYCPFIVLFYSSLSLVYTFHSSIVPFLQSCHQVPVPGLNILVRGGGRWGRTDRPGRWPVPPGSGAGCSCSQGRRAWRSWPPAVHNHQLRCADLPARIEPCWKGHIMRR